MAKQIPLSKILPALDRKDRTFFDDLSEEEKKAFSGYLLTRYSATVEGSPDLEYYYLVSANHCANKSMFELSKHKKLQWLMLTAVSPGIGVQRHVWLKQKSKKESNPLKKKVLELFPNMKPDDAKTLSKIITKKELDEYIKDRGE